MSFLPMEFVEHYKDLPTGTWGISSCKYIPWSWTGWLAPKLYLPDVPHVGLKSPWLTNIQHHHDQWKDNQNAVNWETVPELHSHLGSHTSGRATAIWVWFALLFKPPFTQPPLAQRTADWQVLHCWAGCSWCPLGERRPKERECTPHMYNIIKFSAAKFKKIKRNRWEWF